VKNKLWQPESIDNPKLTRRYFSRLTKDEIEKHLKENNRVVSIDENTKKHYVYFIQQEGKDKDQPIKIGVTTNVDVRLKELQTGNPNKLVIRVTIPCKNKEKAYKFEKKLHNLTAKKYQRLEGEWFLVYGHWMSHIQKAYESNGDYGIQIKKIKFHSGKIEKDNRIRKLSSTTGRLRKEITELGQEIEMLKDEINSFYNF
jgi:predicted GIY-YIG superfamily endonuclease